MPVDQKTATWSRKAFLNLGTMDIWAEQLSCGAYPVHYRMSTAFLATGCQEHLPPPIVTTRKFRDRTTVLEVGWGMGDTLTRGWSRDSPLQQQHDASTRRLQLSHSPHSGLPQLTFTRAYSRRSSMGPFLHSSVWMTFFPPLPCV